MGAFIRMSALGLSIAMVGIADAGKSRGKHCGTHCPQDCWQGCQEAGCATPSISAQVSVPTWAGTPCCTTNKTVAVSRGVTLAACGNCTWSLDNGVPVLETACGLMTCQCGLPGTFTGTVDTSCVTFSPPLLEPDPDDSTRPGFTLIPNAFGDPLTTGGGKNQFAFTFPTSSTTRASVLLIAPLSGAGEMQKIFKIRQADNSLLLCDIRIQRVISGTSQNPPDTPGIDNAYWLAVQDSRATDDPWKWKQWKLPINSGNNASFLLYVNRRAAPEKYQFNLTITKP